MRKKSFFSRALLAIKRTLKRGLRSLFCTLARKKSYLLFGLPSGLSSEIDAKKNELSLLYDQAVHFDAKTIEKVCHPDLRASRAAPLPGFFYLERGFATNLGGQLTSANLLITTYLQSIDQKMAAHHDLFRFSTSRFRPRIHHTTERVATLATGWQGAFYHWMFEVLPRFAIYRAGEVIVDKFYIESRAPFQKESLQLLGIQPEQIINAAEYQAVSAPKIAVSSIPLQPTSWSCQFLRESMKPYLKKEAKRPKRIYVSRSDAPRRRVLNEADLYMMLQRYGFERVILTDHSFQEQMNIFHNAEWIVAPHGAGLSHLAFTDPGSRLLELFAPAYVVNCYWKLANVQHIKYHYLFSEPREDVNPIDPDLYVNVDKVESVIKQNFCQDSEALLLH